MHESLNYYYFIMKMLQKLHSGRIKHVNDVKRDLDRPIDREESVRRDLKDLCINKELANAWKLVIHVSEL